MIPCPENWSIRVSIGCEMLLNSNPASDIIGAVSHYSNISQHQKILYIILIELYNNAVEHGLLELDSDIKNSPSGFEDYYNIKQQRIKALHSGQVNIHVMYVPGANAGELHITVQDTGSGFDYKEFQQENANTVINPYGRGISLVTDLCSELTYSGNGNTVTAVYML